MGVVQEFRIQVFKSQNKITTCFVWIIAGYYIFGRRRSPIPNPVRNILLFLHFLGQPHSLTHPYF